MKAQAFYNIKNLKKEQALNSKALHFLFDQGRYSHSPRNYSKVFICDKVYRILKSFLDIEATKYSI